MPLGLGAGVGAGAGAVVVAGGVAGGVPVGAGGFSADKFVSGPGAAAGGVKYMNAPTAKAKTTTPEITIYLVFVVMFLLYTFSHPGSR